MGALEAKLKSKKAAQRDLAAKELKLIKRDFEVGSASLLQLEIYMTEVHYIIMQEEHSGWK
jgi:hypothetical protein